MSCNWYLVCRKCKKKVDFWRYTAGGRLFPAKTLREHPEAIGTFVNEHSGCGIVVINDEEQFDDLMEATDGYRPQRPG